MEKPLAFKAKKEVVNGKEILVIKPIATVVKHSDGRQDVTLQMPCLNVIAKAKEIHGIR